LFPLAVADDKSLVVDPNARPNVISNVVSQ
jgi:hypothetical protein